MQRLILIFFIASELCYYLLIAQTGVVEYFSSNLFLIAPLPIGGVIGSLLVSYIKIDFRNRISLFLIIQLIMSFLYPNFNMLTLFILGFAVGSMAPLIINEIKKTTLLELGLALTISYVTKRNYCNYINNYYTNCFKIFAKNKNDRKIESKFSTINYGFMGIFRFCTF